MRSPSPIFYVPIYFLRIPGKGYSVRPSHCVCVRARVGGGVPVESLLLPPPIPSCREESCSDTRVGEQDLEGTPGLIAPLRLLGDLWRVSDPLPVSVSPVWVMGGGRKRGRQQSAQVQGSSARRPSSLPSRGGLRRLEVARAEDARARLGRAKPRRWEGHRALSLGMGVRTAVGPAPAAAAGQEKSCPKRGSRKGVGEKA